MNEVTRRITEEILVRANEAIGRGEAKGPKLDQCWKRFEKLNGGMRVHVQTVGLNAEQSIGIEPKRRYFS